MTTSFPGRTTLPAKVSTTDTVRLGKGPLRARCPALSGAARRALAPLLAYSPLFNAAVLVAQAFLLASACGGDRCRARSCLSTELACAALGLSWLGRAFHRLGHAARSPPAPPRAPRRSCAPRAVRSRLMALGPEWVAARGPAELTTLATKGLDALDAYFTDYLPALVTAACRAAGCRWAAVLVRRLAVRGDHRADRAAAADVRRSLVG